MDRLIQDVLTYSRVARSELDLQPTDVEKLLRDILETYPSLQAPGAEIRLQGPFPLVLGAEAVLTQCFANLLSNAVKFVAPGVTPRVRVWAETQIPTSSARLCFRDNGVGVPPEAHGRMFGIFQRLSNRYEGTGIGLAIVKKGAERMGGAVGFESALGSGSTFWLELKLATPAE
jgi:signal transduction histidine kinase